MPEQSEPNPGKSSSERDLIAAAFGQADERPSAFDAEGLPPVDSIPGYEILKEIHRGGQGVVYQAVQKATKRRVAIKVLHEGPFSGSAGKSRFEREVQILGQLNHPNIVRIHDSGTTASGSFFYVMDYISGRSLDQFVQTRSHTGVAHKSKSASKKDSKAGPHKQPEGQPWDVDHTLRLFLKICDAVNAAHLRGVIHRDLKPANIRVDNNGEPIVVDFGLAKIAVPGFSGDSDHPMTVTGQFIGSLPWASPEQAEGSPDAIDVRTDVYSLGVILYQLLTGKFPYAVVGNMRDVLDNILRAEPARPSTVRRQINDEVETIVLKCLSKEKARRYQTAGELARDIQCYLAGEPIEAKRDSGWYVLRKTLRRYRVSASVVGAFVALSVASAVVMSFLYDTARTERNAATVAAEIAEKQRVRAEENFKAARNLANILVTGFAEDVENLRGATPAKKRLLDEALGHLKRAKLEAGDDPELKRELADAYEKVADVEGGLFMPRLGTQSAAGEHYAKAAELRDQLLVDQPDDPRSHIDAARSQRSKAGVLRQDRKFAQARTALQTGIAAVDVALTRPAVAPAVRKKGEDLRAELTSLIGDTFALEAVEATTPADADRLLASSETQYASAAQHWSARAQTDRSDSRAAQMLGVLEDKRAANLIQLGKAAVRAARRAIADGKATPEAIAGVARAREIFDRARGTAESALSRFEALAQSNPANAAWARDQYLALHNIGFSWSESADAEKMLREQGGLQGRVAAEAEAMRKALPPFERALEITRDLAKADSKNLEAARDLAVCLNRAGNVHRFLAGLETDAGARAARFAAAQALYQESYDLRDGLVKSDPMHRHTRDLALAAFKLGQLHSEVAPTLPAADRAKRLAAAVLMLEEAERRFSELVSDGVLNPEGSELKETRAALAKAKEAAARGGA